MAYFQPGSDPEFFVKPQVGELLPLDTEGTLITVGFKPRMYSRKYKATLAIQVSTMKAIVKMFDVTKVIKWHWKKRFLTMIPDKELVALSFKSQHISTALSCFNFLLFSKELLKVKYNTKLPPLVENKLFSFNVKELWKINNDCNVICIVILYSVITCSKTLDFETFG